MTSPFKPGMQRGTGAAKSHRVGPAMDSEGARTMAYRASAPLVCARCKGRIEPDALFSRRSQRVTGGAVGTLMTEIICVACRPLRLEETADGPSTLEDKQDG